jgi:hypothetical protein
MSSWAGLLNAGAGTLFLAAAIIMCTVGQWIAPRLILLFVCGGSMGLAGSQVGGWIQSGVSMLDAKASSLLHGFSIGYLTGTIGALCLLVIGLQIHFKKISMLTLIAGFVAPYAAASVPGLAGTIAQTVFGAVGTILAGGFSFAFTGHF